MKMLIGNINAIYAKSIIQILLPHFFWIPAFTGMTFAEHFHLPVEFPTLL